MESAPNPKPETELQNSKPAKKNPALLAIIITGLVIAATAGAYYVFVKISNPTVPPDYTNLTGGFNREQIPNDYVAPTTTPDIAPSPDQPCESYTQSTRQLSGDVAWEKAREVLTPDIFALPNDQNAAGYTVENSKFYKVGQVLSGKYQGYDVILGDMAYEGPMFYSTYYRYLKNADEVVLLALNSGDFSDYSDEQIFDRSKLKIDNDYALSDLDYPDTFQGAINRENYKLDQYAIFQFCSEGLEKVFTHAIFGDVYTTQYWDNGVGSGVGNGISRNNGSYGFYLASPDGTTRVYSLVVDFIGADNVPKITWSDGSANTNEYTYSDIGGCGSTNYLSVIPPDKVNLESDLVKAGKNIFGDDIYFLKDTNNFILKDIYDNQYYVYDGQKVAYEDFIKSRPVFFWSDPYGRLVKFQNNKFIPQAECAKPVIYLYPESTQAVSVQLSPAGGFTFTEPVYGTGWNVIASPDGRIVNQADGKVYPYLFWEGRGGIYQTSKKGFVVAKDEVHGFLSEKLSLLGLNQKESADFMEFWEPRMQSAPYHFVTFYGNAVMDALAPLQISPAPDTVIRVLMDFTPLQTPMETEGYDIRTPARRGFTVVEWGGVIR